jgi:hypothetical protein
MAFIPAAIFNIIEGDVNYRKIVAEITSDPIPGVGVTYNVYYRVDGPIAALRVPNFSIPDGVLIDAAPTASMPLVSLPLDSAGSTLEGNYKLTYYVEDAANPGVYTEVVSSITLDVLKEGPESCRLQARIGIDVNCVCYRLTVTDNTVYGNANEVTLLSRVLTIIPPTIPGGVAPAPITTTDPSIQIGFDYANVTYIVNLLSLYQHENSDGTIIVQENLVAQISQRIVCDFNLCKLIKCINDTIGKLERRAAQVGGWPNLPLAERDMLAQMNQLWMLMEMYRICGNYNKVYEIYNRLVDLINCDCGCTESNVDHPIAVSAACGGAGGNITDINGTSPVLVNQAGTTATISLDPNFITAALATLTSLNLTAPIQGSIGSGGTVLNLNLNPSQVVLTASVNPTYAGFLSFAGNTPTAGNSQLSMNPLAFVLTASIAPASAAYLSVALNTPTPGNAQLSFNSSAISYGAWTTLDDTWVASMLTVVNYSGATDPLRYSVNGFTKQMRLEGGFFAERFFGPDFLTLDINLTLPASIPKVGNPIAAFNPAGDCVGYVTLVRVPAQPTKYNLFFYPNATLNVPTEVIVNGIFNLD